MRSRTASAAPRRRAARSSPASSARSRNAAGAQHAQCAGGASAPAPRVRSCARWSMSRRPVAGRRPPRRAAGPTARSSARRRRSFAVRCRLGMLRTGSPRRPAFASYIARSASANRPVTVGVVDVQCDADARGDAHRSVRQQVRLGQCGIDPVAHLPELSAGRSRRRRARRTRRRPPGRPGRRDARAARSRSPTSRSSSSPASWPSRSLTGLNRSRSMNITAVGAVVLHHALEPLEQHRAVHQSGERVVAGEVLEGQARRVQIADVVRGHDHAGRPPGRRAG